MAIADRQAWRTTSRRPGCGAAGSAQRGRGAASLADLAGGSRRSPRCRREAHLTQGVAVGRHDPVAEGAVGGHHAGGGEEGPGGARRRRAPTGGRSAPAAAQDVDHGVEQPRAVALAPGVRVHARAPSPRRPRGRHPGPALGPIAAKPDDLVAGAGDEQPVHPLRRGREAVAPGARERVGSKVRRPREQHGRHTPRGTRWPAPGPRRGRRCSRAVRTLASARAGGRHGSCPCRVRGRAGVPPSSHPGIL